MASRGPIRFAKDKGCSCSGDRQQNHGRPKWSCIPEPRNEIRICKLASYQRPHDIGRAGAQVDVAEEAITLLRRDYIGDGALRCHHIGFRQACQQQGAGQQSETAKVKCDADKRVASSRERKGDHQNWLASKAIG